MARPVRIGREALRCLLTRRGISFQRTKTWKESQDADFDAKPARIEYAIDERPDRTFAFDEFGPLGIRPTAGPCWVERGRPARLPATFRRTHGITYFHGCCSVGDDQIGAERRRGRTPASVQSRSRHQAVIPEQPTISAGTSRQATPVRSTYMMPTRAALSGT